MSIETNDSYRAGPRRHRRRVARARTVRCGGASWRIVRARGVCAGEGRSGAGTRCTASLDAGGAVVRSEHRIRGPRPCSHRLGSDCHAPAAADPESRLGARRTARRRDGTRDVAAARQHPRPRAFRGAPANHRGADRPPLTPMCCRRCRAADRWGASGDLAPLAHLALPLLGRGRVRIGGEVVLGAEGLRRAGLAPLELGPKEGLALINGTQAMTSLLALSCLDARRLVRTADLAAALSTDALRGTDTRVRPTAARAARVPGPARLGCEPVVADARIRDPGIPPRGRRTGAGPVQHPLRAPRCTARCATCSTTSRRRSSSK